MTSESKIAFLTLIAGRRLTDDLLSALSEANAKLINTMYGRGTVKATYLQNTLGLVPEENKVMITCVLGYAKATEFLQLLIDEFHFDKPNTGVAFTMPIEKLSF